MRQNYLHGVADALEKVALDGPAYGQTFMNPRTLQEAGQQAAFAGKAGAGFLGAAASGPGVLRGLLREADDWATVLRRPSPRVSPPEAPLEQLAGRAVNTPAALPQGTDTPLRKALSLQRGDARAAKPVLPGSGAPVRPELPAPPVLPSPTHASSGLQYTPHLTNKPHPFDTQAWALRDPVPEHATSVAKRLHEVRSRARPFWGRPDTAKPLERVQQYGERPLGAVARQQPQGQTALQAARPTPTRPAPLERAVRPAEPTSPLDNPQLTARRQQVLDLMESERLFPDSGALRRSMAASNLASTYRIPLAFGVGGYMSSRKRGDDQRTSLMSGAASALGSRLRRDLYDSIAPGLNKRMLVGEASALAGQAWENR